MLGEEKIQNLIDCEYRHLQTLLGQLNNTPTGTTKYRLLTCHIDVCQHNIENLETYLRMEI